MLQHQDVTRYWPLHDQCQAGISCEAKAITNTGSLHLHVVVDAPAFKKSNFLWVGSKNVLRIVGQAEMVLFLAFFLLLVKVLVELRVWLAFLLKGLKNAVVWAVGISYLHAV
jgi:hypothetical protein